MSNPAYPDNPEVPPLIATAFSTIMSKRGYTLDQSIQSLEIELELILNSLRYRYFPPKIEIPSNGTYYFDTGLSCYMGQTLSSVYDGVWQGYCGISTGENFYTTHIKFGDFKFNPFAYIGYRRSNGKKDTGTVKELLLEITPSMKDKTDLKRKKHAAQMQNGNLVVDNTPWT